MATSKEKYVAKALGKPEADDDKDEYEMPRADAIEEHVNLIRILRTGSKAEQMAEADKQEKELQKIKSGTTDD